MRFKTGAALAAAMLAMVTAGQASAATLKFTLNGPARAVWFLDSNPTPDAVGPASFVVNNVAGNFSGIPGNTGNTFYADIEFYNGPSGGGFNIYDFYDDQDLLTVDSAQLFGGTTSAPTFAPGTYTLTDFSDSSVSYSLSIAAVPEPATWAFMIGGFGAVGGSLRARRVKAKLQTA